VLDGIILIHKISSTHNGMDPNDSNLKGLYCTVLLVKVKVLPQQATRALGGPGRLRPPDFSTFGTTRVVGRQLNAPAAFTPGEFLVLIFRG
jgi:hypothetical protein